MEKLQKNKYKGFARIDKIMPGKIKEYKLEKAFYKYQAIKYWEEVADNFINDVKDAARAVDLKNGVLVVACLSKELAYQIKLLAHRIINEINQLIGKEVVYAIVVES